MSTLRRLLLVIFVVGVMGTGAELFMLRHTEGLWQLLPIGMLATGMGALSWWGMSRSPTSLRAFRALMGVFVLTGAAGVLLHFQGNAVYEVESMPGIAGFELFRRAVMGTSPTLAPGTMVQLGLVGFAYTFRHPALVMSAVRSSGWFTRRWKGAV